MHFLLGNINNDTRPENSKKSWELTNDEIKRIEITQLSVEGKDNKNSHPSKDNSER